MYLVFDIGGTYIKYGVSDAEGNITDKDKKPTPSGFKLTDTRLRGTTEMLVDILGGVYDEYNAKYDIDGIALSIPGQIDIHTGMVYGGGALTYLHEVNLGELLKERCDGKNIALENDAKCAALAEAWIGNAQGAKAAAVIVFGTGIGGGIIIDGKVHHGVDLIAGEFSWWIDTIRPKELANINTPFEEMQKREDFLNFPSGLWNGTASMMAVRKTVAAYKNMHYDDVTGEMVYEWAAEGDKFIISVLEESYLSIAKQCMNIHLLLAPEVILLGGGISANPLFYDGVMRYINKLKNMTNIFRSVNVKTCKYLNDSNMIGAVRNYQQLYEGV